MAAGARAVLGVSAQAVPCDGGFGALQAACTDTFEGSAPCSTRDYLQTTGAPVIAAPALIGPWLTNLSVRDDGNAYALDASGQVALPASFNCGGWSGANPVHLVALPGGRLQLTNGGEPRPVLCCNATAAARVLGPSAATARCDEGFTGLQAACAAAYEGGYPCSTREYLAAPDAPALAVDTLIRPSYRNLAVRSDGNAYALDESGLTARPETFTCGGWSGQNPVHLVLRAGGRFDLQGVAEQARAVLCCGRD